MFGISIKGNQEIEGSVDLYLTPSTPSRTPLRRIIPTPRHPEYLTLRLGWRACGTVTLDQYGKSEEVFDTV